MEWHSSVRPAAHENDPASPRRIHLRSAEKELEEAKHLVKTEMEATGKKLGLSVPLKVDLGTGHNWRVAHP
jgi:hypothetical protein